MPFQMTLDEWMAEELKKQKKPKPPKPPKPKKKYE